MTSRPSATRLVNTEAERYPYTKVRDWIALLPQATLSDGAFRLYYLSRSLVWENTKGGPPPRPVIEITYEEYASVLGRSARTISRFAQELYGVGLWEVVERSHHSVRVPGKARPEVRTVMTVRVHDFPQDVDTFAGPVKTWDVLSSIRDKKRKARPHSHGESGPCAATAVSAQSDQSERRHADEAGCDRTDLSSQSPPLTRQDHRQGSLPAETQLHPGRSEMTELTASATNLSGDDTIVAGQPACGGSSKKKGKEEKPTHPPSPSAASGPPGDAVNENVDHVHQVSSYPRRESLVDELAMFSDDAVELVSDLYDTTVATPGLQPLSGTDRAGLARRIDSRLAEGWSVSRIRAVLTGGSLVGVKMPGRLWAGRLDDMPAFSAMPRVRELPATRVGATAASGPAGSAQRPRRAVVTNDCSSIPDRNAGKVRYQVPDDRGVRLVGRWADESRVAPWCGRCSSETRTIHPIKSGQLPRPCPSCHPDPGAFSAPPASVAATADTSSSITPR